MSWKALRDACEHLWVDGANEERRQAWEGESWEPPPRPEGHPFSPSTHLPIERGLDRQVAMTGDPRYGVSMRSVALQGAK